MKAKCTVIAMVIMTVGMALTSQAAKWRVNNNPAIDADFYDIQAAHDFVYAGDTLYIEGSSTSYGGPYVFTKKLIVIGPGYFLSSNDSPQHNKNTAYIAGIQLAPGSEGTVLSGLELVGPWGNWGLYVGTNNVIVKNCRIYGYGAWAVMIYNSSNVVIQQCYIDGNQDCIYIYSPSQNILIQNNFIYPGWNTWAIYMEDGTAADFSNNVIWQGSMRLRNGIFRNNIFCSTDYSFDPSNVVCTNNISGGTHFGGANGNQSNIDMNTVFICWNDCTGRTVDDRYMLLPTGVAIGAGYGGVDCGIFDGPAPYSISGLTNVPAIWEMGVSGINVTIKAKSH